jgi:predicted AlkP superfamily pyrophosphatase or phosphodiesterase
MRGGRSVWLLLAMALGCAQGGSSGPPAPELPELGGAPRQPSRLVLISVSGLTSARYQRAEGRGPAMPTLAALAASGVAADQLRSVAPAASYPAHATLLSGRRPSGHGIVADRRLGDHGVRAAPYSHASLLKAPVLWQLAAEAGLRVASLGWPSTVGGSIALNVPDLEPSRSGETWFGLLGGAATPGLLGPLEKAGGAAPAAQVPGAARDAVLVKLACGLIRAAEPPQLLLLHLSQTAPVIAIHGAVAEKTRRAFAGADAEIAELLDCARANGTLERTAFAVVGDHGVMPVHTVVAPNAVLAAAGLLTPQRVGSELLSWSALVRSNGGSAFVYARRGEDAVLARRALEDAAARTGAFRVVSADEMLSLGADPEAWFGLEATPGYVFADAPDAPLARPAVARASWGYLPHRPEMDAAFVAWGPGLGRRVKVPEMRQIDVAPTLAPLLGLAFEEAEGRVLVGVLRLPQVSAVPTAPR